MGRERGRAPFVPGLRNKKYQANPVYLRWRKRLASLHLRRNGGGRIPSAQPGKLIPIRRGIVRLVREGEAPSEPGSAATPAAEPHLHRPLASLCQPSACPAQIFTLNEHRLLRSRDPAYRQ